MSPTRERLTRVAVLISGRGSNLLALLSAIERGEVPAEIVLVVSNRAEAGGLQLAMQLASQIRTKAVEAAQDIFHTQV